MHSRCPNIPRNVMLKSWCSPEGMTPPLQQQLDAWEGSQDASVVTPGSISTTRYVEPQQQQELQQQPRAAWAGVGGGGGGNLSLDMQQPMIPAAPLRQIQQQPIGGGTSHHQHQQPPQSQQAAQQQAQQQQPRPSIPTFAPRAPVAAPIRATTFASSKTLTQPNKRLRVAAPPVQVNATTASSKGSMISHSFTSASASTVPVSSTIYQPGGIGLTGAVGAEVGIGGSDRQKSQAQQDRRRERNRILARRTRLRKKFFFESLQKDVSDLQRENAALKSIVRSRLRPEDARPLLERCNANELLPSAIHNLEDGDFDDDEGGGVGGGGSSGYAKMLDREDFSLIQSIQNSQQCFVITDPSLHDNPIVYASDDFLSLTGYTQEEVLGRNCRFLQGSETDPTKVATIRKSVEIGGDVNVTLVNYTSEGVPFWNSLFIAALRDADDNIVNFIGVIVKVNGPEPGDSEYGKVLY